MESPNQTSPSAASPFAQTYFHGTKADLKLGDLIRPGYNSNFKENEQLKHVYLSSTLDAAIWGAELALGNSPERIYLVEPTGALEDDPNLTNKKFPGNPTMSYRSEFPFRVVGEVSNWQGHSKEQLDGMKAGLARLQATGMDIIE